MDTREFGAQGLTVVDAPTSIYPARGARPRPRGLWLCRQLPFPQDSGDRVYSANLARSLAEAGAELTMVGLEPDHGAEPPPDWPIDWHPVKGPKSPPVRALLSPMPHVAATFATRSYRREVRALRRVPWDFVVIDHYGMGWSLRYFAPRPRGRARPVLVHVSHDHETTVYAALYREFTGSMLKRIALWQNYAKTRVAEGRIARQVDLLTAITDEEARHFSKDALCAQTIVLRPGYAGADAPRAAITRETPRQVLLIGSFQWMPKQENLRLFIQAAEPLFRARGIELHVVGRMPRKLAAEIGRASAVTHIHGFVADVRPHFARARMAVVPELIGGGFKLKLLDYIFGHLPVAALRCAAAGLPPAIGKAVLCRDDLHELASGICEVIDDTARLNAMQEEAYRHAKACFRWSDRGRTLLWAIRSRAESA